MRIVRVHPSFQLVVVGVLTALLLSACGGQQRPVTTDDTTAAVVSELRLEPVSLLLLEAGERSALTLEARTASGALIATAPTWTSSDASVVSVTADGVVSALGPVGAAVVQASVGDVTSNPVLVVVARLQAGVVPLADAVITSDPVPEDPSAPFAEGWRYRVDVATAHAPPLGSLVVSTGSRSVAGRVVAVEPNGGTAVVLIELVPLDALFDSLRVDLRIDLAALTPEIPADVADAYAVTRSADGTLVFTPRSTSDAAAVQRLAGTTALGIFECESNVPFPIQISKPASFTLKPALSLVVQLDDGPIRLGIEGGVAAELTLEARVTAAVTGAIMCEVTLARLPLPIGGPLAFVVGGSVPLGVGFGIDGTLTVAQFGGVLHAASTLTFAAGIECDDEDCQGYASGSAAVTPRATLEWPFDGDDLELRARLRTLAFADLALGSRFGDRLSLALTRTALNVAQTVEQRPLSAQFKDPPAPAGFATTMSLTTTIGKSIEAFSWLKQVFKVTIAPLELTLLEVALAESPKGRLSATPERPRAGSDTVTFSLDLDPVRHFSFESVEAVHVYELDMASTPPTLVAGPEPCRTIAATPGQTTFTCSTTFDANERGERSFVAAVSGRLFNVPLPARLLLMDGSDVAVETIELVDEVAPLVSVEQVTCEVRADIEAFDPDAAFVTIDDGFTLAGLGSMGARARAAAYGAVAESEIDCGWSLLGDTPRLDAEASTSFSGIDQVLRAGVWYQFTARFDVGTLADDGATFTGPSARISLSGSGNPRLEVVISSDGVPITVLDDGSVATTEVLEPGQYTLVAITNAVTRSDDNGCPFCVSPSTTLPLVLEVSFEPAE